jgi:hypothetical protein
VAGDDCDGDIPENDCREMHQIGVGGTMAVFITLFLCWCLPALPVELAPVVPLRPTWPARRTVPGRPMAQTVSIGRF